LKCTRGPEEGKSQERQISGKVNVYIDEEGRVPGEEGGQRNVNRRIGAGPQWQKKKRWGGKKLI